MRASAPLVGIASCGYLLILGVQPNSADQSRVLQGLITGIGFVGGGAILKEGAKLSGAPQLRLVYGTPASSGHLLQWGAMKSRLSSQS
jgi:putative Mg2+ transporter-C (MgtC) family protein